MKKITKRSLKHKHRESLEVCTIYDPMLDADIIRANGMGAENLPDDPKEFLILELSEMIKHRLEALGKVIEDFDVVDEYENDYSALVDWCCFDEKLKELPYIGSISISIAYLAQVRAELLKNDVDDLTISLLQSLKCGLSGEPTFYVEYESQILAGKARVAPATESRMETKKKYEQIAINWATEYRDLGWSQQQIVTRISRRLSDEHQVERKGGTIAGWLGYSKNLK
ncbi:hypothetical protein ACNPKZ_02790 [Shewanella algae]|uniref:hypothetical protein n=1 Tax=Shewanella algae TaxID=38313 RepID=UPI003AAFAADC